ncbi:MAG: FIST N-terminal domain-containing protein [Bdellovibrionales bacterium]
MKSLSLTKQKDKIVEALEEAIAIDPSLILLFAAPSLWRDQEFVKNVLTILRDKTVLGCSTAGEIGKEGFSKDSFSMLAMHFDNTSVKAVSAPLLKQEDSLMVGESIANQLKTPDLKAVLVFGIGRNINGSGLINGMNSILGRNVLISGGLAGDGLDFKETFTLCNGDLSNDHVVAVGLYGDSIIVSCGSEGGWRPFGPTRRVTKADNNILYELDGKPALQLYKQYLGDKAKALPASGLAYPFAILRSDRTTSGLIRSALDIDHEKEAIILAGDMPQGCQVCLMHADTDALVQGAAQAAAEALRTHAGSEENGCAIVVSCVGRRIILGIDVDDEIEAVSDSFLPETPMAGYYSYGEICSYTATGRTELHNQTMTITYITEKSGE